MSIEKLLDDPETCMTADEDPEHDGDRDGNADGHGASDPTSRMRTGRTSTAAARLPQVDILSGSERNRLIRLAKEGDDEARSKVVLAHIPMAIKLARLRSRNAVLDEDTLSAALVGVVNGVDRYDPDMSGNSSAYIGTHIANEVRMQVIGNRSLVTIKNTPTQQRIFNNLSRAKRKMRIVEKGWLDWQEAVALSEDLNAPPAEIQEMESRMNMPALGLEVLERQWIRDLNPLIDTDRNHFDEIAERDGREKMRHALRIASRNLTDRERDIMRTRMLSRNPDILETLGQRHGVTRERIRQLEARIMTKLRVAITAINPDLAMDLGWRPQNDAHDDAGELRITGPVRNQGQRGEWIMVVDAAGEEMASYLRESNGAARAAAFVAGHAHGRGAIAIDPFGLSIQVDRSPRRYEVVHHEVVLCSYADEYLARAWIDGLRFGYRSSALREAMSHEQRSRWTVPLRRAGEERPAWDHGIEDQDDEPVEEPTGSEEGSGDSDMEDPDAEEREDPDPEAFDDIDPSIFEDMLDDAAIEAPTTEDPTARRMIPVDHVTAEDSAAADDEASGPMAADSDDRVDGLPERATETTTGSRGRSRTARRRSERAVQGFMQWHAARTKPRRMGR